MSDEDGRNDDSPRPKKKQRTLNRISHEAELANQNVPSLYELLPCLPQLSSALSITSNTATSERKKVLKLVEILETGPTVLAIRNHLEQESKRLDKCQKKHKKHFEQSGAAETEQEQVGSDEHTRVRRRRGSRSSARLRSSVTPGGIAGEQTEGQEAGDEFSDASLMDQEQLPVPKRSTGAKKNYTETPRPRVPEFKPVKIEVPEGYASGPLLAAIHSHISRRLTNSFNIVPQLDEYTLPFASASQLAHFSTIHAAQAAEETQKAENSRFSSWHRWTKHTRGHYRVNGKNKVVGWKQEWRNADRSFEDSALVALGLLLKLEAEELLQQPGRKPEDVPVLSPKTFQA